MYFSQSYRWEFTVHLQRIRKQMPCSLVKDHLLPSPRALTPSCDPTEHELTTSREVLCLLVHLSHLQRLWAPELSRCLLFVCIPSSAWASNRCLIKALNHEANIVNHILTEKLNGDLRHNFDPKCSTRSIYTLEEETYLSISRRLLPSTIWCYFSPFNTK